MDNNQKQTQSTFAYKWSKENTYQGEEFEQNAYNWEVERYFGTEEDREKFFQEYKGKSFLDAGCGSGFSAKVLFNKELKNIFYTGVDISDAVWIAKEKLNQYNHNNNVVFQQENIQIMNLEKQFDVIFSEGVIHHTSEPYETFKNLSSHLKVGGKILFYIYVEKAPIREFTDDYIRDYIKNLDNDQAWEELLPLSKLGKSLGDLNISIPVEEDINVLGIPKGEYNLQRLFYYFFAKAYYKPEYSIDELNHINFDWYRPTNCFRFKPQEIEEWLKNLNYKKERFIVEESGITVVATKMG